MKKIISLEDFKSLKKKFNFKKKKIILCHGVFDLLHIGHFKHFKEAKKLADVLIVSVTPDKYINKGPGRPFFSENLRLEALSSITDIDYIVLNHSSDAIKIINLLKPHIYFKGPDYKNNKDDITKKIYDEKKAVENNGGQIKYSKSVTFSSSNLLNKSFGIFTKEQNNFLQNIKKKYNFSKIKKIIEDLKDINVLVVGETIIDEYVFCEALGKSGKESVLALRNLRSEKYLGGALAISQNLVEFVKNITVLSCIGDRDQNLTFIKKNIDKRINLKFLKKNNSQTILKKRFLDDVDGKKILGVYNINDDNLNTNEEKTFLKHLDQLIKKNDIVIVSDYGHGIITDKIAKFITRKSKKLSVNAQVNAANIGFHNIRKYKKFDTLIINATELRHEMRERSGNFLFLAKKLKKEINVKNIIVTQGKNGAMGTNNQNIPYHCPSFTDQVIDKIGAGDTLFAIYSLFISNNTIDIDLPLLLSSLAAAENVKIMGNKKPINKFNLLKSLESMFK